MNYQELICKLENNTYDGRWTTKQDVGIKLFFNNELIFEIFRSGQFNLFNLNQTSSNMDKIIVEFLNQPKEDWFKGVLQ